MKITYTLILSSILISHAALSAPQQTISDFASEGLSNWKTKEFSGTTDYSVIMLDNIATLKAETDKSASGIAKEKKIDLKKTPFINWSWRIDNRLTGLNERSKDGDDYAARLYIVNDGGWQLWKTKALNYVWSSNQAKNSTWDNAFVPDNAKMLAVQGIQGKTQTWYTEKRNVYLDMIAQFGDKGSAKKNEKAYRYIDVVALMSDTDNSQLKTTAYYRDIYFSEN